MTYAARRNMILFKETGEEVAMIMPIRCRERDTWRMAVHVARMLNNQAKRVAKAAEKQ